MGLVDPRDNAIRYVGLSDDVKVRQYHHTRGYVGNVQEQRWIEELQRDGLVPVLQVLETIDTGDVDMLLPGCEKNTGSPK